MGGGEHRLLPVVLTLACVMVAATPAAAHAVLERSVPSSNAILEVAPSQVVLTFSEPVDAMLSSVAVLDGVGQAVSLSVTFSHDRQTAAVHLSSLPRGVYAARWRILSAVDGHITSGGLAFGVGQAPPSTTQTPQAARPDPPRVALRWLALLAALLLAGSTFFQPLALRPALAALPAEDAELILQAADNRLRGLGLITSASLAVILGAELLLQAVILSEVPVAQMARETLRPLLWGTRVGWSTLLRIAMALLLMLPRSKTPGRAGVPLLAAAGLLAGFTSAAHASGQGLLAILADWLHITAVTVWIGGLASLLLVLQAVGPSARAQLARVLVPRFSTVAGISLGIVVITGLYSAWLHVPAVRALVATSYGLALNVKLLLVLPLIALGAINRFVMRPRLAASTSQAGVVPRFVRIVTGEVILGAAVLLAVAVLTMTPPARVTFSANTQQTVMLAGLAGDVRVRLTIDPAQPGWNRYEAVAADADRRPLQTDARLLLRFVKLDEDVSPTTITLTPAGEGRYAADGGEMAVPGWWELEVVVRRRGQPDASTTFPLRLGQPRLPRSDTAAEELFHEARDAPLRSWREQEQLNDGLGSVYITLHELAPPDRMQYRTRYEIQRTQTTGLIDVVVIAADRYERRDSGPWKHEILQRPLLAEGHRLYMRSAEGVTGGRQGRCDDEPCRVVLWTSPGGSPAFAAWIGLTSLRVHRLHMLSLLHYMTLRPFDLDAPLSITAPGQ